MIRLLYISTARAELSSVELETLLKRSRLRNAAADVTGLLVVGGRRFLQVLEGPEIAVTATYNRIKADPRHFAPVILSIKPAIDRLFGTWSMGFQNGGPVREIGSSECAMQTLIAPISDPTVRAYFEQFALKHMAA